MENSSDLYTKARQLMDEGELESAVEVFEQSILNYPHFKSLELMGECLIRLNRLTEAIVPLAAATSLNKGVRAPAMLAETFVKLKDYRQGREIADIALSREPNNRTAKEARKIAVDIIGED